MKKILFVIALFAFVTTAKAQITLEHTYDSASTYNYTVSTNSENSQLMIINFELSGERYVKINRWGKIMDIYDLNHSLVKTISLASLPTSGSLGDILYISEQLFNTDSKIEYMYFVQCPSPCTYIYNEDGLCLFSDTGCPQIRPNVPLQQLPIYNTAQGTKMILSFQGNGINEYIARVYSLPGTLASSIAEANNNLIALQSIGVSNAYPNPTNDGTQIDYTLPDNVNEGEIVFYDLQGNEVKRFKVDKTFKTLLVSTSDIAAGTYYYQLQTTGQNSDGKKLIVIK